VGVTGVKEAAAAAEQERFEQMVSLIGAGDVAVDDMDTV
jgi:hypothetical protein